MDNQKIFFPVNIKFLRERKKMSQENVSESLGISRSKLMALESGQTKAPQPEDLIKFSEYYKISIDSLLKVDLTRLGELKVRELQAGNDVYMAGGNIRILAITVDKNNRENVEYVPVKAKAGYQSGYSDPEFIASLPKFSFPNLPRNGTYRLFPTKGDSMLPIPEGSDVLAKFVQDWTAIKKGTPCIVILKGEQDFVFKKVTVDTGQGIRLESLNTLYEPYVVKAEDILEIWEFEKYLTAHIPDRPTDLQELKLMINDIKSKLHN